MNKYKQLNKWKHKHFLNHQNVFNAQNNLSSIYPHLDTNHVKVGHFSLLLKHNILHR